MNDTFSKELAQALRDADEKPIAVSQEELLHSTYQRLCHDDPVGVTAAGCLALHKALTDADSPYALSRRLVTGIRHCSQRYSSATAPATATTQNEGNDNGDSDSNIDASSSQSLLIQETDTSATAYAQLAWCIHVHIPLQCCRLSSLTEAGLYLGSYLTPETEDDVLHPTAANGVEEQANTEAFIERASNGHDAVNGRPNDDSSLVEVFADESDASDYEFESQWNPERNIAELNSWAAAMQDSWDPVQLSKPPHTMTWCHVATSVSQLLQSLSHSQISVITQQQWKALRISDHMMQLCLALLVPASSQHSPMLTSDVYTADHWQRLGLHVLNVFRDATLHHVSAKTADTDCTIMLEEYLRLVRILLKVDQNTLPNEGKVSPATWVGLSSLSAMCSDLRIHYASLSDGKTLRRINVLTILQSNVVDTCDDLTELLEKSSQKDAEDILALQWTCLALFQVLTMASTMTYAYAQTLLNSGLFRQWLIYWSQTQDASCREAVQVSILDLCLSSPTLLGKYAWRFPGLADQVTTDPSTDLAESSPMETQLTTDRSRLHVFLWNLIGIHLTASEPSSAAPKVQWKAKTNGTTPQKSARVITAESCQQTSWSLFQSMCQSALKILTDWKLRREHKLESGSTRDKLAMQREVLADFDRLATRLLSTPLLKTLFTDKMVPDACSTIREELRPVQQILSQWPAAYKSSTRKPDIEDDDDGDDDDDEKDAVKAMTPRKPSYPLEEEEVVSSLRKAIKTLQSALENTIAGPSGLRQISFSSKAD